MLRVKNTYSYVILVINFCLIVRLGSMEGNAILKIEYRSVCVSNIFQTFPFAEDFNLVCNPVRNVFA